MTYKSTTNYADRSYLHFSLLLLSRNISAPNRFVLIWLFLLLTSPPYHHTIINNRNNQGHHEGWGHTDYGVPCWKCKTYIIFVLRYYQWRNARHCSNLLLIIQSSYQKTTHTLYSTHYHYTFYSIQYTVIHYTVYTINCIQTPLPDSNTKIIQIYSLLKLIPRGSDNF